LASHVLLYELPIDMHTRILIWSLFLLFAIEGNSYAQLPNGKPLPDGWEYVGEPPKTYKGSRVDVTPYFLGDRLIYTGSVYDSAGRSTGVTCIILSEDKGKSWEIRECPFILRPAGNERNWSLVNPYSGTIYGIGRGMGDSTWGFFISHDLGISYTRSDFPIQWKYFEDSAPGFITINPHDTSDILLAKWHLFGNTSGNTIIRSSDAGVTWHIPNYLPPAIDGIG